MPTYTQVATVAANQSIPNEQTAWVVGFGATSTATVGGSVSPPTLPITGYLQFSGFGFSIPSTETVVGISVSYPISGALLGIGNGRDYSVFLSPLGSADRAQPGTAYSTTSRTVQVRGGVGDLWALSSVTPAQINASAFGFSLACTNDSTPHGITLEVSSVPTITITTVAYAVTGLSIAPGSVTGGTGATGAVTINSAAPAGGAVVNLVSDNAAASVPGTVTVAQGQTTATFAVSTIAVDASVTVTVTATLNGSATAPITVQVAVPISLTFSPASLSSGQASTGTIRILGPAGPSGQTFALVSGSPSLTVPATAEVLPGQTTVGFTATAGMSARPGAVTITATSPQGNVHGTISLTGNGLDTIQGTLGKAAGIASAGYGFLVKLLSPPTHANPYERWSIVTVNQTHAAGMLCGSLWWSTSSPADFTGLDGQAHAGWAVILAQKVGQPGQSCVYFYVPFDASSEQLAGTITAYFQAARVVILQNNLRIGVRGSGQTCAFLLAAGLVDFTWLDANPWAGTSSFTGWDITQGASTIVNGIGCNSDLVALSVGGLW